MGVFLCRVFPIMPQVAVTTTTTTSPVTVVCSRASFITMTVDHFCGTYLVQTISGQHDMVLLTQLILRDTVRGSVGLTTIS